MQQTKQFGIFTFSISAAAILIAGFVFAQTQPLRAPECPPGFMHDIDGPDPTKCVSAQPVPCPPGFVRPFVTTNPKECVPASEAGAEHAFDPVPQTGRVRIPGCWDDSECPKGLFCESVNRPPGKAGICTSGIERWTARSYPLTPPSQTAVKRSGKVHFAREFLSARARLIHFELDRARG
jgi:hypothetical protein